MYSSILLFILPLLIDYFSWLRLLIFIFWAINMLFKMIYEEKLLCLKFDEYKRYKSGTYRIIPFIF
jgi:protein-S-isoprenylcysteine O-methyltransferase Ste14